MKNAYRLAELGRISLERELTDEEQREVIERARRARANEGAKRRYQVDPDYRRRAIERSRDSKRRLAAERGHW